MLDDERPKCGVRSAIGVRRHEGGEFKLAVHYLEIVSNDADALTGLYERMHGLSFGPPDPDLGQARVATRSGRNPGGHPGALGGA